MKMTNYIVNKNILVGSCYFFNKYEDFKPKDKDYIRIIDKGNGFNYIRQLKIRGNCYFDIIRMHKNQLIEFTLKSNGPTMRIGKFLIPEFNEKFNITIDDLKCFDKLFNSLDNKHKYEKIIYNAYITNNDFYLTDEQRELAYKEYKKYRKLKDESIYRTR